MRNILMTLIFGFAFVSSLSADMFRVEMGAGAWANKPKGSISYTSGGLTAVDTYKQEKQSDPYFWMLVKYPVPLLPNFRLEYVDVSTKGTASGTFKNFTATGATTQLDITQFDIIPYYNILDTAGITLDLGLDIKVADIEYKAEGVTGLSSGTTYTESETIPIPLLYVRIRTEIPLTDIGFETDAKFITDNSSSIYDVRVKVDYTLDFIAIKPALEVGYRIQKYKIDDNSFDSKIDLEFSGFYAGLMIRF